MSFVSTRADFFSNGFYRRHGIRIGIDAKTNQRTEDTVFEDKMPRPMTSISHMKWVAARAWLFFSSREDQKEPLTSIAVEEKLKEATGGESLIRRFSPKRAADQVLGHKDTALGYYRTH
jgi:hypothetical protein